MKLRKKIIKNFYPLTIKERKKSFMSGYRIAHLVVRSASTSHHKELMVSLFDVQNKLEAINFSPALSHTEASNMP